MGLYQQDIEKVPKGMSVKQCYERIYDWHKKYGKKRVKEKYGRDDAYSRAYLDLVTAIPPASKATQEDMDFVFGEVISMLMEWSYHEEDENRIKIAAYAHFALNKQYAKGFHDEKFKRSRESSKLFTEFGYPKWKEKYKQ
ncbi:MAG: hypothetical protein KA059_04175 [Elusimicrobiales bacterium]|nr:hypothetical protein [Elusimicrobiales bacterium]